ncbi:hypothetical protein OCK74_14455 [Chitinophagaceae bacterium LB-8]|uniref:Uncharacterized protein n=1 Tax=Paraflavisolibacter caeni TaxID=2982496 RepID=A0A9X2XWG0_9BACT|nr:hypothetical protein [Paraflavisolibacter caeni]MCU7550320.1 hypothetical protein [Paraflavisolibacter caeni]
MVLKDQICPLVHAKRLKEFGIIQESLLYYNDRGIVIKIQSDFIALELKSADADWVIEEGNYVSAFTVAELGAALPNSINGIQLIMENSEEVKYVSYPRIKTTFGRSEAQARANMLLWLIENKYVSAREVNKMMTDT